MEEHHIETSGTYHSTDMNNNDNFIISDDSEDSDDSTENHNNEDNTHNNSNENNNNKGNKNDIEDNNSNEDKGKYINKEFFYFLCFSLILVISLCGLEILFYHLLRLISVYNIPTFLLDVLCHLILIRFLFFQFSFQGQNPFIKITDNYEKDQSTIQFYHDLLIRLKNNLIKFDQNDTFSQNEISEILNSIDAVLTNIRNIFNKFCKIQTMFNDLNPIQSRFINILKEILLALNDTQFIDIFEKSITKTLVSTQEVVYVNTNQNIIERQYIRCLINHKILKLINEYETVFAYHLTERKCNYLFKPIYDILCNQLLEIIKEWKVNMIINRTFYLFQIQVDSEALIDCIIIKAASKFETTKNNLMIICGPSRHPYEHFAYYMKFHHLCLKNHCDVLFWNYRGYGFSTGKPTYDNVKSDILKLYDYVVAKNEWNEIGVYGILIGGLACFHLARNRNISLLISDRNFAAIDLGFYHSIIGYGLNYLYKLLQLPDSYNIDNYMNSNFYKIVLNDPADEIVDNCLSLKTNVSRYIIEKYLRLTSENEVNISIQNKQFTTNKKWALRNDYIDFKDILDIIYTKEQKDSFINILISLVTFKNQTIAKEFSHLHFKSSPKWNWCKCIRRQKHNYKNLKEEELNNTIHLLGEVKSLFEIFFSSFQSAGDTLTSLLNFKSNRGRRNFICNFFSNLFVWGNKKPDCVLFKIENSTVTINKAINCLDSLLDNAKIVNFIKEYSDDIVTDIQQLIILLKQMDQTFAKLCFTKHNDLQSQSLNNSMSNINLTFNPNQHQHQQMSLSDQLMNLGRGHLIDLNCGYDGQLNEENLHLILVHMKKCGFIIS